MHWRNAEIGDNIRARHWAASLPSPLFQRLVRIWTDGASGRSAELIIMGGSPPSLGSAASGLSCFAVSSLPSRCWQQRWRCIPPRAIFFQNSRDPRIFARFCSLPSAACAAFKIRSVPSYNCCFNQTLISFLWALHGLVRGI
jgi:hypothetical protein